jgi:hypothetical protein
MSSVLKRVWVRAVTGIEAHEGVAGVSVIEDCAWFCLNACYRYAPEVSELVLPCLTAAGRPSRRLSCLALTQ